MLSTTRIAVACAAISLVCRAERPAVEWAQYPVGPGDNVLLQGGNWGEDATVEIAGRKIRPAHKTDTGLVFAYPSSRREIVRGRVTSGNVVATGRRRRHRDAWRLAACLRAVAWRRRDAHEKGRRRVVRARALAR